MTKRNIKYFVFLVTAMALLLPAINYYTRYRSQSEKNGVVAATVVEVKTIKPRKVLIWSEFSGRLQAVDAAEIRPEVSGRITEVRFEDGAIVKAGDVLFVIDPRPYEAALAKAEAQLATAVTNANFAGIEIDRATKMIKTQAIAQRIYDERYNTNQVALAAIKSAEAELKRAQIDLDHAYLKAPISGRVGRVEITLGNLVQAGVNAPLMTRIVTYDPIYADFEVDEQTYMQSVRNVANNRHLEQRIPVELYIHGDNEHVYQGKIYSFDNRLDIASGTIRARAKFNNTDGVLIPGMFVSVKLASGGEKEVFLIPQQVIGSDQSKKYVYIVDKNNRVIYRQVVVGKEVESERIILSGLEPGDRVIVKGIQHVKPDEVVEVKEELAR